MFVFIHIAQHFNPRSREGSDVNLPINVTLVIYFNPRSREGSDEEVYEKMMGNSKFQSTLPRGERLGGVMPPKIIRDFNPRSREGSDCKSSKLMFSFSNFNPRSREGSDIIGLDYVPFPIGISIHAPARGATVKF